MADRRARNADIFRDTEKHYKTNTVLKQAIQASIKAQRFISIKDAVGQPIKTESKNAKVLVSGKRSLEAAEFYAKQGKKVCVLNFRSVYKELHADRETGC